MNTENGIRTKLIVAECNVTFSTSNKNELFQELMKKEELIKNVKKKHSLVGAQCCSVFNCGKVIYKLNAHLMLRKLF